MRRDQGHGPSDTAAGGQHTGEEYPPDNTKTGNGHTAGRLGGQEGHLR